MNAALHNHKDDGAASARANIASTRGEIAEQAILLGLLDAVERGDVTQRSLSRELGIAVGLVNTYVKRCINKGLIKIQQVPPRRFAYYLTPKGFLEKSQLVASYLVRSFDFFRSARASCEVTLSNAVALGCKRIGLVGASELTEIAVIVATEIDIQIVAIIDNAITKPRFAGIQVIADIATAEGKVDAVMITSLSDPQGTYERAVAVFGAKRVYMPSVLANIMARSHQVSGTSNARAKE